MNNRVEGLIKEIKSYDWILKPLGIGISCNKLFEHVYRVDYYVDGRSVSYLNFVPVGPVIEISLLSTPLKNNRRKHYSKNLLAIVLKSAQRLGYHTATATSVFMNNKNKNNFTPKNEGGPLRPLSAPLFNNFRFGVINRNEEEKTEIRRLNMTRNMAGVNATMRNLMSRMQT